MTKWRYLAVFEIDLETGRLRLRAVGKQLGLLRDVLSGSRSCKIEAIGQERKQIRRMTLKEAVK
jgi:hypothetical protein